MKQNYQIKVNDVIYNIEIINTNSESEEITYSVNNEIHKSCIFTDTKLEYINNKPTLVYYDYIKVIINDEFYKIEL